MVKRPQAAVDTANTSQHAFDARYQTNPQRDCAVFAASSAEPMTPVMHPSHSNMSVGVILTLLQEKSLEGLSVNAGDRVRDERGRRFGTSRRGVVGKTVALSGSS